MSAQLAITLFLIAVTGGVFLVPMLKKTFVKNEIANMVFKRGFYTIGTFLLMLDFSIVATIAKEASMSSSVVSALLRLMVWFGWAGMILAGFMVLKTLFDVVKMYRKQKFDKRFGDG
jgi:hypothetical protein